MKAFDKNGREVCVSVYGRYSDDIQIEEANYIDTDEEVSEDTLEYIYDNYADSMYETWYDTCVGEAEAAWEGDR